MPSFIRSPFGSSFIENLPTPGSDCLFESSFSKPQKPPKTSNRDENYTIARGRNRPPPQRGRRSASARPTTPTIVEEVDEELYQFDTPGTEFPKRLCPRRVFATKRRVQSFEDRSSSNIIYSTSPSFDSVVPFSLSSSSNSTTSSALSDFSLDILLEEVEPAPVHTLQTKEETTSREKDEAEMDIGPSSICWTPLQSPPSRTSKLNARLEELEGLFESEGSRRRSSAHLVKPKPLSDISRDTLIAKYNATRPLTPSLLSFNPATPPAVRRRIHPERTFRSKNGPPDPNALRKDCIERYWLLREGITFDIPSRSEPKPFLFPRAGHLSLLRSVHSTSCTDDWNLGYIDLSFIQKTLYAFDMKMRVGSDLWAAEDEIYRLFGTNRSWENDWDMRWRIANWLLNQEGDGEEGGDDNDREMS